MNEQKYKKPDFICVGLEKTGTTWLYKILRNHPQVFIPPKKEIRFFWEKSFLPNNNFISRFTSPHFHNRGIQRYLLVSIYFAFRNLISFKREGVKRAVWDLKFLFQPRNYSWYNSLFRMYPDRISGEITALTYTIPEEEIKTISQKFPDLKVIILFRDPVDRAWSKAKMKLCKHQNKSFEDISTEQWHEVFQEEFNCCPSYVDIIERWKKFFPEDRIHINFYEKLKSEPRNFLQEICDFLQLDINEFPDYILQNLDNKIGEGISYKIPENFDSYLTQLYNNCIKEIDAYYS